MPTTFRLVFVKCRQPFVRINPNSPNTDLLPPPSSLLSQLSRATINKEKISQLLTSSHITIPFPHHHPEKPTPFKTPKSTPQSYTSRKQSTKYLHEPTNQSFPPPRTSTSNSPCTPPRNSACSCACLHCLAQLHSRIKAIAGNPHFAAANGAETRRTHTADQQCGFGAFPGSSGNLLYYRTIRIAECFTFWLFLRGRRRWSHALPGRTGVAVFLFVHRVVHHVMLVP